MFIFKKSIHKQNTSYPSPVRAQHAWMCHWWSLIDVSFRNWEISATVMQFLTSCLLAKMSKPAFLKSYSKIYIFSILFFSRYTTKLLYLLLYLTLKFKLVLILKCSKPTHQSSPMSNNQNSTKRSLPAILRNIYI